MEPHLEATPLNSSKIIGDGQGLTPCRESRKESNFSEYHKVTKAQRHKSSNSRFNLGTNRTHGKHSSLNPVKQIDLYINKRDHISQKKLSPLRSRRSVTRDQTSSRRDKNCSITMTPSGDKSNNRFGRIYIRQDSNKQKLKRSGTIKPGSGLKGKSHTSNAKKSSSPNRNDETVMSFGYYS